VDASTSAKESPDRFAAPQLRGGGATAPDLDLTAALCDLAAGQAGADARVMPLIYARLRALAEHHLVGERAGHTLQATALVNEAYLKLVDQRVARWDSRAQFFAFAAHAMRRILLDHARARGRQKRGGGLRRVSFDGIDAPARSGPPELDLIALDEALERFATHDAIAARVVEMRFFAGMEVDAIALVLGVTDRTVRRHWVYAKAWLGRDLARAEPGGTP
jgi:RNA polymerase sigma factor (TIGR02999 family)